MTKELWINLPVKDVKRSKEFFAHLGFSFNAHFADSEDAASMIVGTKNIVVMLFRESTFKGFTMHEIPDTQQTTQVLFSFDAESREEVDAMARKAEEAGGSVFAQPGGHDWMYGCGFADLDGHRWNVLYMDMAKMPQNNC